MNNRFIWVTASAVGLLFIVLILLDAGNLHRFAPESGNEAELADHSTRSALGQIHIQYAQWSISSVEALENAIQHFNETNSDHIYIELLHIPLDRYMETLNQLNASGSGPDVYEVMGEWMSSYITKGWAANLKPFVDDRFLQRFPDWAREFSEHLAGDDASFYSIPSNQITYRLMYNKTLFQQAGLNPDLPPKTLKDFGEYARKISESQKGKRKYGTVMPLGEEWTGFLQQMEALGGYSGVYYYNFKAGRYDFTVYEPWLDLFAELNRNGGLFPGVDAMKSDQARTQFVEGNIGMMFVPSWEALQIMNAGNSAEWGISMPPALNDASVGKGAVKIDPAGWNVINPNAADLDKSLKVWNYLYSDDFLGQMYREGTMIPVPSPAEAEQSDRDPAARLREFLPGSRDSIYPMTPLLTEEWVRKGAYATTFNRNQGNHLLLEESAKLNTILDFAATAGTVNINRYYDPKFDPQHPYFLK